MLANLIIFFIKDKVAKGILKIIYVKKNYIFANVFINIKKKNSILFLRCLFVIFFWHLDEVYCG